MRIICFSQSGANEIVDDGLFRIFVSANPHLEPTLGMKKHIKLASLNLSLVVVAALSYIGACTHKQEQATPSAGSSIVAEESIDCASPLMASPIKGEKILKRHGYSCSFNTTTRLPNYVSWILTPSKLEGTVKRSSQFYEDPDLEQDNKAWLSDYYASGYDRGHMCPAADNKWSKEAMAESFYLSNICPQTHTLNDGDWEMLESVCRKWVRTQGITLHIVCGPIFDRAKPRKIKRLPVPDRFFKAVVCLDGEQERGIGFIYGNGTEQHPMSHYACTIDDIEQLTGYDLFARLSKKLQEKIESQSDLNSWF